MVYQSFPAVIMYEHYTLQLILYFIRGAKVDFSGSLRSVTNMSSNYWQLEISKTIFYFNAERLMKYDNFSEISRLTVKWSKLFHGRPVTNPKAVSDVRINSHHYLLTFFLKRILSFLLLLNFTKYHINHICVIILTKIL